MSKIRKPTDYEIELVADIFAKGNKEFHTPACEPSDVEWILGHAFILGAKYMRNLITNQIDE